MSNHKSKPAVFIYTALPCEAKPIIEYFRLKKDTAIHCFAVYRNEEVCLVVTGIGKAAMAASIAYSQALYSPASAPVMLNVGVAGHKHHAIGEIFLIDKISDYDSGRRFYPPIVFTPPCATQGLQTAAKPQTDYPANSLCDMEGAAFYETATRFSTGELTQCLKVVSDNAASPLDTVNANLVAKLVSAQIPHIDSIINTLGTLAQSQTTPELPEYLQLLDTFRFTANERIQLKKLLSRWQLQKSQGIFEVADKNLATGKDWLNHLERALADTEFHL